MLALCPEVAMGSDREIERLNEAASDQPDGTGKTRSPFQSEFRVGMNKAAGEGNPQTGYPIAPIAACIEQQPRQLRSGSDRDLLPLQRQTDFCASGF